MEVDDETEFVDEMFESDQNIALPGDLVTSNPGFMRGHGTYPNTDGEIISSVAGRVEQINKLISVQALRARYIGETGDVIVGRIIETQVGQKRWRVETSSRLDSILLLNHIDLPSGELRRKTIEDEMMMKTFFKEGDLIVAEVQSIFQDGSLSLHTRSFGRVGQGTLVKVPPSLIERRKDHFHNLPSIGVHIILANNGNIWISPSRPDDEIDSGFDLCLAPLPLSTRQLIARMRNSVEILKFGKIPLNVATIKKCYLESMEFEVHELLKQKNKEKVLFSVRKAIKDSKT